MRLYFSRTLPRLMSLRIAINTRFLADLKSHSFYGTANIRTLEQKYQDIIGGICAVFDSRCINYCEHLAYFMPVISHH